MIRFTFPVRVSIYMMDRLNTAIIYILIRYSYCHSLVFPHTSHLNLDSEPVVLRLQEGEVANLTVLRAGRADFVATVMYQVEYGDTSPADLTMLSNDTLLVFDVGEWMKNISVAVEDDKTPETDERFYIVLYNATGQYGLPFKQLVSTGVYCVLYRYLLRISAYVSLYNVYVISPYMYVL